MSTPDRLPERKLIGLPLSIGKPALAALAAMDITTLQQVSELSRKELQGLHGIGPKAVRILEETLRVNGLSLKEKSTNT